MTREVAENFAQALRDMKDGTGRFSQERCNNCGFAPIDWIESKPIEVKVEKQGTGYRTRCYFRCPKCGEKVEGNFFRWIT